jgi:hypothetical protein
LIDLLNIARLRVSTHVPERDSVPDNFGQLLAAQDCVVLVGDHGSYDEAFIRSHARHVLDARSLATGKGDEATATTAAATATVGPQLASAAPVTAVYTGVVPIVYKAQRMLLDSLVQSTFWSFITIAPLMMYLARALNWSSTTTLVASVFRSLGAGSVAMLPNVLPVLMVFGGMGWLDIDIDIGSMMTASIALGVAVDDTIHYLNWFREDLDRVGDRKKAILAAYRHCATPTLQAAVIGGLGLSIFALSTFTPTQRFGYLMLSILWMGVVAELIFFPALLAGPLGAFFQPRPRKADAAGNPATGNTVVGNTHIVLESQLVTALAGHDEADHPHDAVPPPHRSKTGVPQSLRHDSSHNRSHG